ncbi:MAG: hypothetical protein LAT55_07820 [Opitutales bacterium]|nr:hypothetical protein [Opitutales bacterium]
MKEIPLTEILSNTPIANHPSWLEKWESPDVNYLVRYDKPAGTSTIKTIGPHQELKTLAKALGETRYGILKGYTPTMHFSLRSLEYQRKELEGRITLLKEQQKKFSQSASSTASRGSGEKNGPSLSEREKTLNRREKELDQLANQLAQEREMLDEQAQFVESSEAKLNEHFQQLSEKEAEIEQKEEDLRKRAFRAGVGL